MKTPYLETERLKLRTFKIDDTEEVFKCWESDPRVAQYMFWTSHYDINKTKEWVMSEIDKIENDEWYRWCIEEKSTGNIIGTCLIYYEDEVENYEIAYNFGYKYWGKGYATEAMKEVISFAKDKLEIKELVGRHANENTASENVLKKLGFKYEKDIPYECNDGTVMLKGKMCILHM
ncbi:MAG: GNAT family N-acetyltransferase [Clostridium sp.]|nr:GNAT family N-acetyltransferase [Clostridium sp.]